MYSFYLFHMLGKIIDQIENERLDRFIQQYQERPIKHVIYGQINLIEDYYKKFFDIELTGHKEFIESVIDEARGESCCMSLFLKSVKDDEKGKHFKKSAAFGDSTQEK